MKRTNLGAPDTRADFLNMFAVAEPKVGKTTYLVASALGALPGQDGGLVSGPDFLHILAVDTIAVDGLCEFLVQQCKMKPEHVAQVDVLNFADDVRTAYRTDQDQDYTWFRTVNKAVESLQQDIAKKPGVHAIIASSLTGMVETYVRAIAGAPSDGTSRKSGSGMSIDRWQLLTSQLTDLRTTLARDTAHILWEGHVQKGPDPKNPNETVQETIAIPGQTGRNWGYNTDQVVRLRREMNRYDGTKIDKVFADTKPNMSFVSGGRGFGTQLDPKEYDIAKLAAKLGRKVGGMKCN